MATFDYAGIRDNVVKPLLAKFGNPVLLKRDADLSLWERRYDPTTESFVWVNTDSGAEQAEAPPDKEYQGNGVFVSIEDSFLKDSLVKTTDSQLLIEDVPKPETGDVYTYFDGVKYSYVTHKTVDPAGITLLYKVIVRT